MPNPKPRQTASFQNHWTDAFLLPDGTRAPSVSKGVRLSLSDYEWLASLDGTGKVSHHVRQAVQEYRNRLTKKS
jgi:hypothetical protein